MMVQAPPIQAGTGREVGAKLLSTLGGNVVYDIGENARKSKALQDARVEDGTTIFCTSRLFYFSWKMSM